MKRYSFSKHSLIFPMFLVIASKLAEDLKKTVEAYNYSIKTNQFLK